MKNELKLHNHLGQARYKMELSEQKIFIYALSLIDQEKKKFNEVEFSIRDLADATHLNYDFLCDNIEKFTRSIIETSITVRDPNDSKKWEIYSLATKCKRVDKGIIQYKFNEDMKPLLLELKEHYFVQNPVVITFKKWHAIRLYDFIESMSYNNTEHKITIEELKEVLGCVGKYKEYTNFRRKVLDLAVGEINDKSDLNIEFELVKRGRSAHSILFKFTKDKDLAKLEYIELAAEYDINSIKVKCGIENELFSDGEVLELYELSVEHIGNTDYDIYEYVRISYEYMIKQSNVKSRFSYLRETIKGNWCKINLGQIRFEI